VGHQMSAASPRTIDCTGPWLDIIRAQAGMLVGYRNMRAEIVRIKGGAEIRRSVVKGPIRVAMGTEIILLPVGPSAGPSEMAGIRIVDEASLVSRTSRIVGSAGSRRPGTGNQCSPAKTLQLAELVGFVVSSFLERRGTRGTQDR